METRPLRRRNTDNKETGLHGSPRLRAAGSYTRRAGENVLERLLLGLHEFQPQGGIYVFVFTFFGSWSFARIFETLSGKGEAPDHSLRWPLGVFLGTTLASLWIGEDEEDASSRGSVLVLLRSRILHIAKLFGAAVSISFFERFLVFPYAATSLFLPAALSMVAQDRYIALRISSKGQRRMERSNSFYETDSKTVYSYVCCCATRNRGGAARPSKQKSAYQRAVILNLLFILFAMVVVLFHLRYPAKLNGSVLKRLPPTPYFGITLFPFSKPAVGEGGKQKNTKKTFADGYFNYKGRREKNARGNDDEEEPLEFGQKGKEKKTEYMVELGMSPGADFSLKDLKNHYRTLAMKYHPDKCGHGGYDLDEDLCQERFIRIRKASEYLERWKKRETDRRL